MGAFWARQFAVIAAIALALGAPSTGSAEVRASGPPLPAQTASTGNIVVEKQTLPDGSPQQFTFTPSYGAPFVLSDGQTNDSGPLTAGSYSVAEQVPAGWVLTSAICDDGSPPGNIALDPGETVTCTFTDTEDGKIVVEKQTLPDGDPQTFDFSGAVNGTIGDDGMLMTDVAPGQYAVTEDNIPAGWTLTDISCDDADSTGNVGTATATFEVDPGETVTCTFTDTKDGKIVVEKQTLPDGDPQTFDFSGAVNGTIGDDGMLMTDVAPGQYAVTEDNIPAGWTLAAISCDDGDSTGDAGTATATFDVQPGEVVTCVFTNTNLPTIVVQKQTLPDGDPATFDFSGAVTATLGDGDSAVAVVTVGQHQATETVPAGWVLTSIVCDDNDSTGDVNTSTATFNVSAGEVVRCVFTDTKNGQIVVEKQTDPDGDSQQFTFAGDLAGQLPDNGSISLPVQPGQYSTTETVPPGWSLTAITCDDGNSSGDVNTGTATFEVEAGETVTCVFTNTKNGRLVVQKQTNPTGTGQLFGFSGITNASIPHNGQILVDVPPGQHAMSEAVPAGWQLTAIACDDGNSSGDTNTGTATYQVEAGETVTCVFTNTQEGSVTIVKDAAPADGTDVGFDGAFGPFSLDDDADATLPDSVTFGGLLPGTYAVTETVPAGWELIGLACDDGSTTDLVTATANVDLAAGEDVTCTFTNRKLGGVAVAKLTVPAGDAQVFTFVPSYGASFQLTHGQVTTFALLPAGSYSVSETVPGGWTLTSAVCDDGSPPSAISLLPGEFVTCTFTNTRQESPPSITVTKTGTPSLPEPGGAATFDVAVTNTSDPTDPVTITTLTDTVYGDVTTIAGSTCAVPQVIAPGATYTCSFPGAVSGGPGTSVTNTLTASGSDDEATAVSATDDHTVVIADVPSSISVTKTASPAAVPETGGAVSFVVVVRNTSAVDSVTISSLFDDRFGDVGAGCTPALPHTLVPGGALTCSFTRIVSGPAAVDHQNVVTATGADDDGDAVNASGSALVDLTPSPPPVALPATGGTTGLLAELAPSVVAVGLLVLLIARRRRVTT